MTKKDWEKIDDEINEKVRELLAEKYPEMTLIEKGFGYSDSHCTFKVEVRNLKEDFNRFCNLYGYDKEDYGTKFTNGKTVYTFIGFAPSRSSYPIMCRKPDGDIIYFRDNVKTLIKSRNAVKVA